MSAVCRRRRAPTTDQRPTPSVVVTSTRAQDKPHDLRMGLGGPKPGSSNWASAGTLLLAFFFRATSGAGRSPPTFHRSRRKYNAKYRVNPAYWVESTEESQQREKRKGGSKDDQLTNSSRRAAQVCYLSIGTPKDQDLEEFGGGRHGGRSRRGRRSWRSGLSRAAKER